MWKRIEIRIRFYSNFYYCLTAEFTEREIGYTQARVYFALRCNDLLGVSL